MARKVTRKPTRKAAGQPARKSVRRPRPAPEQLATLAVHAGEMQDAERGLFQTPIVQSSTFAFRNTRELRATFEGRRSGHVYTRYGNPTVDAVERKVAALEGAQACLIFSSGMGAIAASILAAARNGDHVVSTRGIYGGAQEFLEHLLPSFGGSVTFVDGLDPMEVRRAVRPNTRLVYAESPVNPTLQVLDLKRISAEARRAHLPLFLDGTFASPVNQQPLSLGVDCVVHSATKYLGGHSDLIAGAVAGSRAWMRRIWTLRKLLGASPDPHQAWLLGRGLKTLDVRVRRQNEVAMALARHLARHRKVRVVLYPGLATHPQHRLARRQMQGFGGMLAFEPRGGLKAAIRVVDSLRLIRLAASLGGVETICSQPVYTSHRNLSRTELARNGISEGLIRLSCGIEDPADLVADLDQALARI